MENNAFISVKTIQDNYGEKDTIELQTLGKFSQKNGKYYIVYEESELTGFEGSTTTIKIDSDKVSMTRRGKFNTKMIFKKNEKQLCYYDTPYGRMVVAIEPKQMRYSIDENGGNLNIEYRLDIDNEEFALNSLDLNIKRTN